jgi:hypothetical protein
MSTALVYNSINWSTSYSFVLTENGIIGAYDMPEPLNDGLHWIPGSGVPASEGADYGFNQIIVNGVVSKTTNALLLNNLVIIKSSMRVLREAGVFKELYFSHKADVVWDALPGSINVTFFGSPSLATKARLTIVFNAINEFADVP